MNSLLLVLAIFSLVACGIKGKPLPPLPSETTPSLEIEKSDPVSAPSQVKPFKTLPAKKKNQ